MTAPRSDNKFVKHERLDEMFGDAYNTLRQAAGRCFIGESAKTLQPTALVNEAYLRLAAQTNLTWEDRRAFLTYAARVMRQVLVDEARKRRASKRASSRQQTTLVDLMLANLPAPPDLIDVDDALSQLEELDQRKSTIVQMRFFAGMTIEEVAEVLELSTATVNREWRAARAWLGKFLSA